MKLKMKYMKLKGEDKIKQEGLKHKRKNYTYNFQQYETTRSFSDNIYTGKINLGVAEMDQSNLLKNIVEFYKKSRPRTIQSNNASNKVHV